jgi:hypothetical protein
MHRSNCGPYSITSSARASNVSEISRPRVLAALRLMTSSNFVGCSTERSAGFAPRKILSTNSAARRNRSVMSGPREIMPPASILSRELCIVGSRAASSASLTLRNAPLSGTRCESYSSDLKFGKPEIFLQKGLDARPINRATDLPVGQKRNVRSSLNSGLS